MFRENPRYCIQCKSYRRLCGLRRCPLISSSIYRSKAMLFAYKGFIEGSTPPSIIVSELGYPRVRVYLGIPAGVRGEKASFYDDPNAWFGILGLEDIIDIRSSIILASTRKFSVYEIPKHHDLELMLAALSIKPVDTEAKVEKILRPSITLDYITPPLGPSVVASKIKVVSNPYIPRNLEKVVNDEVKASQAVINLYRDGVDFYTIARAFSLGFLGLRSNRKAVPTRWAITAIDQIIGDNLLSLLKTKPSISDILVFYGEYIHNKYIVILSPGTFKAMWIEVWHPASVFNPGSEVEVFIAEERYLGRYTVMDGGYIAARTSVAEYLYKLGKQAKVVIIREILPQYIYPVGSWQIRLTVKYALAQGAVIKNPSVEELKNFIEIKTRTPANVVEKILNFTYDLKQKKLDSFVARATDSDRGSQVL